MTENKKMVHQKIFEIAWGDMDALGHVNNVRYFDYFQEARVEWLRNINIKMTSATGPVVIQVSCTFLKPIIYPATITLKSSLHSLGTSSVVMDHDLYQEEELMAQGLSKVVWVDYKQGKSVPLPDIIRDIFNNQSN